MKVKEAIHRVTSKVDYGVSSDDSRLRPRWVYSILKSSRAAVLEDELRRRSRLSEFNYTTITCAELERATAHQCGCIPAAGCYFYRVKCVLPSTIGDNENLISDVTTLDGRVRFSQTEWRNVRYHASDKYTSNQPRFFIRNSQIYLVGNEPELKYVTIRGLFDDPVAAIQNCQSCGGQTEDGECFDAMEQDFPLEDRFVSRVLEMAYREILMPGSLEDVTNNRRDNLQAK